jgi:hypothetical protein
MSGSDVLNVGHDTAICARTASGPHPVRHIFMWFLRRQCLCQRETGGDEGQDAQGQARQRQVCLVRSLARTSPHVCSRTAVFDAASNQPTTMSASR